MPMKVQPQYNAATTYTKTEMPDMGGLRAFVLPGAFYGACCALMAEAGCLKADSVDDADIVVFIGGEDINPEMYGETPLKGTYFTEDRDTYEKLMYSRATRQGKVLFGICRGAQFIHAENGGKLWQDVNNHAGPDHHIFDIEDDVTVMATSLHHQMLRDHPDLAIVAHSLRQVATKFECQRELVVTDRANHPHESLYEMEIEAGYYTKSKAFFVQGHPEIGSPEYRSWCMNKLWDFYEESLIVEDYFEEMG
jgi:gamma-glutamyl-gamma-aminobutyrate hydrolase PuuD